MAIFPCDAVAHRYPGPQRSLYLTRYAGSVVQTRKLRCCQRHFDELLMEAAKHLAPVTDNGQISMICGVCGQAWDEGLSARFFDQDAEPATWAGEFCAEHAEAVGARLLWPHGRPM